MGIALYSPKLDKSFNSVRAIQFTKSLVQNFHFHQFDPIRSRTKNVQDSQDKSETDQLIINLLAAAKNDVATLMSSYLEHFDMNMSGYDGKTALLVAAAHGHLGTVGIIFDIYGQFSNNEEKYLFQLYWDAVTFLTRTCGVDITLKDKRGRTAADFAQIGKHSAILKLLETVSEQKINPRTRELSMNESMNTDEDEILDWKSKLQAFWSLALNT